MKACRVTLFGPVTVSVGRRGRTKTLQAAWEAWNPDRRMERAMARLEGAGSFYWPSPRDAFRRAAVAVASGEAESARVETIGGRQVARVGRGYAYAP